MVGESHWRIEYYPDSRNQYPVAEFIEGLPAKDQARILDAIRLLRRLGTNMSSPHAKPLTGHKPLWELRPGPYRVLYFLHSDRRFILLHAFRKKSLETSRKEIALAERRMRDFQESEL